MSIFFYLIIFNIVKKKKFFGNNIFKRRRFFFHLVVKKMVSARIKKIIAIVLLHLTSIVLFILLLEGIIIQCRTTICNNLSSYDNDNDHFNFETSEFEDNNNNNISDNNNTNWVNCTITFSIGGDTYFITNESIMQTMENYTWNCDPEKVRKGNFETKISAVLILSAAITFLALNILLIISLISLLRRIPILRSKCPVFCKKLLKIVQPRSQSTYKNIQIGEESSYSSEFDQSDKEL